MLYCIRRLNVVERNVTKQAGQHDDAIHSLNELLAERELQHDVVHQKTAEQVATLAEHLNKTILDSEAKLKDDVNSKLLAVENVSCLLCCSYPLFLSLNSLSPTLSFSLVLSIDKIAFPFCVCMRVCVCVCVCVLIVCVCVCVCVCVRVDSVCVCVWTFDRSGWTSIVSGPTANFCQPS